MDLQSNIFNNCELVCFKYNPCSLPKEETMLYGEIKDIGSFFSFQYQVISLTSEAFNFSVQRPRRGSLCYSLICFHTNKKSTVWASLIPSIFSFSKTGGRAEESLSPPRLKSFFLFTNHYLFPSIPNVHAVSVKTTGTVLQAHFPDGSHLPASPLLSLAHLCDESQHISLAAICLSAFNANQTSEQPRSLMGGGLETSPASLPDKPCFTPLLIQPLQFSRMSSTNILFCFVSSSKENFWSRRYSSSLFASFSRWPLPLIFPHFSSIPFQPPPTSYHFCSCWQGAAIYLSVPAREWVMRVSSVVAEGAAEPDVNIRFESSHL